MFDLMCSRHPCQAGCLLTGGTVPPGRGPVSGANRRHLSGAGVGHLSRRARRLTRSATEGAPLLQHARGRSDPLSPRPSCSSQPRSASRCSPQSRRTPRQPPWPPPSRRQQRACPPSDGGPAHRRQGRAGQGPSSRAGRLPGERPPQGGAPGQEQGRPRALRRRRRRPEPVRLLRTGVVRLAPGRRQAPAALLVAQAGATRNESRRNLKRGDLAALRLRRAPRRHLHRSCKMVGAANPRSGIKVDRVFSGW